MRIYYNNQCIYFGRTASGIIDAENLKNVWALRNSSNLSGVFETFVSSNFDNLIIERSEKETFETFSKQFKAIQAGGGIVWNENEELLMIYRLGKWDLPKGKLDPGEDLPTCAVREVAEETALQNIALIEEAVPTYHIYKLKGDWILKFTAWYKMSAPSQDLLPQAEEDISEAIWVPKKKIAEKLENSYPNIIYLLEQSL